MLNQNFNNPNPTDLWVKLIFSFSYLLTYVYVSSTCTLSCSELGKEKITLNKLSFPACVSSVLHFMFSFSPKSCYSCSALYTNLQFRLSSNPWFIPAHSPSLSSQIYHLKQLHHYSSEHLCPPPYSRSPSLSSSTSTSSSTSSFFTSCWYSPSLWPSGEECCQYILWALVAAYLLLFFTSSFLVLFSDHPNTCHCGFHHTSTHGPSPQNGVPLPSLGPTNTQCKSPFSDSLRNHSVLVLSLSKCAG